MATKTTMTKADVTKLAKKYAKKLETEHSLNPEMVQMRRALRRNGYKISQHPELFA